MSDAPTEQVELPRISPSFSINDIPPIERLRLIEFTSPFHELVKHTNYLSDFNEDIVRFQHSIGASKLQEKHINLRKFWIASSSIYPSPERFTDRRNFANTAKALVNLVLSKSSNSFSPGFALTTLETLCSWMSKHDIYHLQDLTRDHLNEFLYEVAQGRGIASGFIERITIFLGAFEKDMSRNEAKAKLRKYLISKKFTNQKNFGYVFDLDKLSKAIGIRVPVWLPTPFIEKFAKLADIPVSEFIVSGYNVRPLSSASLIAVANIVNLLCKIPDGFDTLRFFPFPDTSEEFALKLGAAPKGRTENIPLEDAVELMASGTEWILEYSDSFLLLGETARTLLIEHPNTLFFHVKKRFSSNLAQIKDKTGIDLQAVTGITIRNLEDVVYALHLLTVACIVVLYSSTGRRKNEIVSIHYGLTYGCLKKSALGVYSMQVYIEKSLKAYASTGINVLAGKAIEVLKKIQELYSSLEPNKLVDDDQLLFLGRRSFTIESFVEGRYTKPDYAEKYLPIWTRLVLGKASKQIRPHMFRRFYALLYFYRYDFPQLSSLSKHFFHFNEAKTFTYITDKRFVEYENSISETLKLRELEVGGKMVTAIEEFDFEYIKIFDGVVEEFMVRNLLQAATGNSSGGFVRTLLKQIANFVKHFESDSILMEPERLIPLAKKLIKEGHFPVSLPHGICFAKKGVHYEVDQAKCADRGAIDRSQASCNVCGSCSNHGTHSGTMRFLEGEINHFESILNDYSRSPLEHARAKKELTDLHATKNYHLSEFERNKKIVIQIFPVLT